MTELSTSLDSGEGYDLSTQLDEGRGTSEGAPSKAPEAEAEKPKPESRMDAIKRAADDIEKARPQAEKKADAEPADAKADKPAEVEAEKPDAEAVKAPETEKKAEQQAADRQRRQPIAPPEKFLPRAKELWPNTPHEVRSEMQRIIAEAEGEATQARESVREYEAVRPYAEMARQSGTTIDKALDSYVRMEQTLRSDPAQGFRALLSNMQMGPQQAIGHILAAFGVAPERLAAHMAQSPNEYTALAQPQRPAQQAQPQGAGQVEALQQQLSHMQQQLAHRDVEATIIAPFAAEHPRYRELEGTIAQFLQSDMIPQSLSPHDRLAAAYDLAVRISPSVKQPPASAQTESEGDKTESRAGEDFGGTKSVRGAPASGVDTSSRRRGKMSRGDALNAAFAELGIAH